VFDKIGLYEESLVRNQDDELNHRLIKRGGRILLVPEIFSVYTARESARKLWQMYYQYGYFKPLAARTIGAVMTARQLVPSVFLMLLIFTALLAQWSSMMAIHFSAILGVYVALDLFFATRTAFDRGVRCGLWSAVIFPILHVSYGIGYLKGLLGFLVLRKREVSDPPALPLSR
jgi:hypothetical protein